MLAGDNAANNRVIIYRYLLQKCKTLLITKENNSAQYVFFFASESEGRSWGGGVVIKVIKVFIYVQIKLPSTIGRNILHGRMDFPSVSLAKT